MHLVILLKAKVTGPGEATKYLAALKQWLKDKPAFKVTAQTQEHEDLDMTSL